MTGLPLPPALPAAAPPAPVVAAAARAWIESAVGVGDIAADLSRALGADGGWTGVAAGAAAGRAAREGGRAIRLATRGLTQARALGEWSASLADLARSHAALHHRLAAFCEHRSALTLVPDTTPAADGLRHAIWVEHTTLTSAIRQWADSAYEAEERTILALRRPTTAPLLVATDAAWRSLLATEDSAAARATRAALAEGDGSAYLLDYEPERFGGNGSVVISYGDPTTADDVAVVVPGITNDATTMADVGALALAVGHAASAARPAASTATIAWLGYDAPSGRHAGHVDPRHLGDLARTLSSDAATEGAADLEDFVDRLAVSSTAAVTVVGHSYGSTTAAIAARHDMDADRLVLLGSPGAGPGAHRASDLRMPVWVASDDLDPVTWVGSAPHHGGPGALGEDPSQRDFGAVRLPTAPVPAPHLDEPGRFVDIHMEYLQPGSPTAAAVGAVVADQPVPTVPARTTGGASLAAHWLAGQAAYELTSWRR